MISSVIDFLDKEVVVLQVDAVKGAEEYFMLDWGQSQRFKLRMDEVERLESFKDILPTR